MILRPNLSPSMTLITKEEFAQSMANLGPYEPSPHLAVAVSGGADSLALVLLANQWVKAQGGTLTALTVDHQLRPTSAQEAHQVQQWLSAYGIKTVILTWSDEKSERRLQEKAREARYQRLAEWCRLKGVLHLLLGHHFEDQQETISMRMEKHSGLEGLAGMSAVVEKPFYRLLRPLLTYSKQRLQATLTSYNQAWIEDPSNQNPKFKRVELRGKKAQFSSKEILLRGQQRITYEETLNTLIPKLVTPFPEGYALLNYSGWSQLTPENQLGIMQRLLMTYGRSPYPPARESLVTFIEHFQTTFSPRTLHGCLVLRFQNHALLVTREPGAIHHEIHLNNTPNTIHLWWDQRFMVKLPTTLQGQCTLKALGQKGWEVIKKVILESKHPFPYPVALTFPSLWQQDRLVYIPNYFKIPTNQIFTLFEEQAIKFLPRYPLTRFTFTLA